MKTQHKKKAFTLTELLVVVIVIGVLSAVVLPKFNKVIETRKTTEAEELMAAVRTEQERRCALDKDYISDLSQLSEIIPSKETKNFVYSASTTGIEAQSKGKYGYTLKMPSYKDGRLCCENEAECLKLNKDYPLCSDLIARADYQTGAECAGEPLEIECSGSATRSCGCQNKGTQSRTCDKSTGTWSDWSTCTVSDACACTGTKPETSQTCNGCGTQTRNVSCDTTTGEWKAGAWSSCSKTPSECITCPEGKVLENGKCVCEDSPEKELCFFTVACDDGSESEQVWNEDTCTCEDSCPKPSDKPHYLRCHRLGYFEAVQGQQNQTHSSKSAAQKACEIYGKNVSYYEAHSPTSNCPHPNKPCTTTPGWGARWYCTEENIPCGAGIGQCDPCSCYCGVG